MTTTQDDNLDFLDILGPRVRKAVEKEAEHVAVPAGQLLFEQGEPSDALYILVTGSLGVYAVDGEGGENLIAMIRPGETVGEMGVVACVPRMATVRAIRDSELLTFSKARFDYFVRRRPEMMQGISRILVNRLRQASRGVGTSIEPKTVAFIAATPGVDLSYVADQLANQIRDDGAKVAVIGTDDASRDGQWFTALESEHDHVLLRGDIDDEEWLSLCTRQADRIVLVGDSANHGETRLPEPLLRQRASHQLLDLLLLHDDGIVLPRGARRWLGRLNVNRHFHVRRNNRKDWSRIARVIAGRGVGLVLSGGGARAYAHVGVLKALMQSDHPIDFVGGTSMGGIISAGVAAEWTYEELEQRIRKAFVDSNPLSDYTLPFVGLVRGRKVERLLEESFGSLEIPDLWKPWFCVSSNLTNAKVHVHRRGAVCRALRASIALPGIIPPLIDDEGVLVDGAVLNNLPVDIMRSTHRGPIAAVNVARDLALKPETLRRESGSSWFGKLRRPPIVSILIRSATVTGEEQDREQSASADLLIEPPLGNIEIRDWKAFDEAVEIGYAHASRMLEESGQLLGRRRRVPVA